MNHDPYSPNHEGDNGNQPNDDYIKWRNAMKDEKFQSGEPSTPLLNPESEEHKSRKNVIEAIRMLKEQELEYSGEGLARPKTEVICDHSHIEGQRIDVIGKIDCGTIEFRLKLRDSAALTAQLATKLEHGEEDEETKTTTPSGAVLQRGNIAYKKASSDESYILCDAFVFEKNGVKVFVADPSSRNNDSTQVSHTKNPSRLVRTAIGLVVMEAPSEMDPKAIEHVLEEILEKDLDIPNALGEVTEEAEKDYKIARYKWQHKITGELTPEQIKQAEKMEREEVFPGYTTFVERGKHKEYLEKYGKGLRAIHELYTGDTSAIYQILTQGVMSTTERYVRGKIKNGRSSQKDLDSGGGDNVFTHITPPLTRRYKNDCAFVVFKPEIFDRTDWYTYDYDCFGTTDDSRFSGRLSPDEIFAQSKEIIFSPGENEGMFRTGIGAEFIESIKVDPSLYNTIIAELKFIGLAEVNGKPIEEIITPHGKPQKKQTEVQTTTKDKIQAENRAKMQALVRGEEPYTSADQIIDIATSAGGNYNTSIKTIVDALVIQGKKEQLSSDITEFMKKSFSLDFLKVLSSDKEPNSPNKELFTYLQNALDIDYNALYKEALSLQKETPLSESKI